MRRYSESIAAALNNFLTKDNWKFFFDKEKGIFCFGLSISSKIKKVQYYVQVRQVDYKVCAVSPIGAEADDHEQMAKMAEFVCRANYGLNNGNFELDLRDGEIRYKCYVDCAGSIQPTEDVVRNSIYCPAMMFEKYAPGIVDIIFGDLSAKEAVDKCEDDMEDAVREALRRALEHRQSTDRKVVRLSRRFGSSGSGEAETVEEPEQPEAGPEVLEKQGDPEDLEDLAELAELEDLEGPAELEGQGAPQDKEKPGTDGSF